MTKTSISESAHDLGVLSYHCEEYIPYPWFVPGNKNIKIMVIEEFRKKRHYSGFTIIISCIWETTLN